MRPTEKRNCSDTQTRVRERSDRQEKEVIEGESVPPYIQPLKKIDDIF